MVVMIGNYLMMKRLICAVMILLQGCAPAAVGGAGAMGTTAAEERGLSGAWEDTKIKSSIMWAYSNEKGNLVHDVDVVVRRGKVLLTGSVKDPKMKIEAVRIAWKTKGVKEVVDEVDLDRKANLKAYSQDTWITTKVKTALLVADDVRSLNYTVQTIDGVVYVMGYTTNAEDLERAMNAVRYVDGVKEVVNYVEVKQVG